MKIKILGCRGEIEESCNGVKNHSGILIDNILFDLGETFYLDLKPVAIFVTHLHPDHFFPAKDKVYPETLKSIEVYAPEKPDWIPKDAKFKIIKEPVQIGRILITPIPVIHSKKVKSVGYLLEVE